MKQAVDSAPTGQKAIAAETGCVATTPARSARRAAIAAYQILDTPPESAFDDIAALAATICGTSMAAISLVCNDRQWFKSEHGIGVRETPVSTSFCAHAANAGGFFLVPDAAHDDRFADNMLVTGAPHVRFYAAMPLVTPDGVSLGALCVLDPQARPRGLDDLQRTTLRVLADQVVAQLELRKTISQRNRHLAAQFANAEELRWLATHDTLTHLPNRALFHERLEQAIGRAAESDEDRTAVLMLDVDHFKQLNDTLGHDAGDALLRTFAARLSSIVRASDTVARLGGDEFAIVLPGIGPDDELAALGQSVLERLREPFQYNGRVVECRASIGMAVLPDHAKDGEDLLKMADIALCAAKAAGRGGAEPFRPEMLAEMERQMSMLNLARAALKSEWITPFYQPKIELRSGRITGFEALLRWQRPEAAVQDPATIAAAFEDPQLALEISKTMIAQVAADMRGWLDAGIDFGSVAINASAAEFSQEGLAERLLAGLEEADVPPALVELEVTESVFLGNGALTVEHALRTLSAAGVRIALDDFGTGYASLSHLKRFPVDVIKIDRSFVHGLGTDADNAAIIRAVLNLGQSLGMTTVAEGIETGDQLDFLRRHGCDVGQGYLFGAATPAERVPLLLAQNAASRLKAEAAGLSAARHPARPRARGWADTPGNRLAR